MVSSSSTNRLSELVRELYGPQRGAETVERIETLVEHYRRRIERPASARQVPAETPSSPAGAPGGSAGGARSEPASDPTGTSTNDAADRGARRAGSADSASAAAPAFPLDHSDAFLITYGGQFRATERKRLEQLAAFLHEYAEGTLSGVHILPFFPYSSDDGFSVIDYRRVDPAIGEWSTVRELSDRFRLMADLVLNHCSVQSEWFRRFLRGEKPYDRYFITVDPNTDLSDVVRPRPHPLLTPFDTVRGVEHVWTTFSEDQVDLDYSEPAVLLEMLDVLLFYVEQGVQVLRLDAVAYLWKEIGTPCIHHPKTHAVVKLMRLILEEVAPWALIITETNVPHEENVSYFGDGGDEAHMVYNFPLPPLVLYTFVEEDCTKLRQWASSLEPPSSRTAFFNFLASHDGVGLMPARGILSDDERARLIEVTRERGAYVSYKATPAGEVPYEINVNYLSALTEPELPPEERARQFLAAQSVMLAVRGVPAIYIHSLLGSENDLEGMRATGRARSINRARLELPTIRDELAQSGSLRRLVYDGFRRLLAARRNEPAFHPNAPQTVLESDHRLFAIVRGGEEGGGEDAFDGAESAPPRSPTRPVLCLHNVASVQVRAHFRTDTLDLTAGTSPVDIVSGTECPVRWKDKAHFSVVLEPFQVLWLRG